ncbi:MAG TPA: substrate-binding domain-containing protein [Actinomycetes bacterium]|jgi:ABC-type sugar transport system substrate-binding protein|nr:substrate-binding domain-containing protein [Actinomycetes bacterium]
MQRPSRRKRGTGTPWGVALLIALTLTAVACAPSREKSAQGGATTPGATSGAGTPQLTDDFSAQHAKWASETVDTAKFRKDPPYNVAMIVQGPTNGWGTIFDTVMRYELKQSGKVKSTLYVPWDGTTESQANGIDDAIAKKVDVIVLTALSRAGLKAPVERAVAAGIPVVTCMATVAGDGPTVDVSRNLPVMGYESAKALAGKLNGKGNVVLLHGIAGVDAAEFWKSGAHAALKEFPGIKIVAEENGNWSVSDSLDRMRAVLTAQPKIDGVWVGGLEMGVSVINAFKDAGRQLPVMAGTNPINGFLRLAIENKVDFVAAPFPPGASKLCVDTMLKVLNGESVPRFTEVASEMDGTQTFGADEAKDFYRPQFNDDWIGPEVIPESAYLAAGFARK